MIFLFVFVGFVSFVVLPGLGDLYLVLLLKFCFVLLLTRTKSKDISYMSGKNEDVIDPKAQSPSVRLSEGWLLPGDGELGAKGDAISGHGLSEGSSPTGRAELGAGNSVINSPRHGK